MSLAINSIATYIPTCDEFNAHWTSVNADRIANALAEITLKGGYTRAMFEADRNALEAAISATEGFENVLELATTTRDNQKNALVDRLKQFRAGVQGDLDDTPYVSALSTVPSFSMAESKWLRAFDDMADLWARINADTTTPDFTAPLLLRGGYTLADFTAELAAMRAQFKAVTTAENNADIGRAERDALLSPIRARMLQYRKKIAVEYDEEHPLFVSLPDLYASSGGATPTLPTFPFNWQVSGSGVLLWFQMIANLVGVDNVFMQEGGNEFSTGVVLQPGQSQQVQWTDVTIEDEVDEVVLRNAAGDVLATGVRDESLADPGV